MKEKMPDENDLPDKLKVLLEIFREKNPDIKLEVKKIEVKEIKEERRCE